VSHVRQTVRFVDGVRTLYDEGVRTYLELGPHGVLSALAEEAVQQDQDEPGANFIPTLRKGRDEVDTFLTALAELHVRGFALDWKAFFAPYAPRRVDLPTYAFQRERFWLEAPRTQHADLASAGQISADHPLLAASVSLALDNGSLFTGRLSLSDHPWLAGHAVFGAVILPGTAFVEIALLAAHRAGLDVLEELTLESPLVIPAAGAVLLQMHLASADGSGRRALSIHSRPEPDAASQGEHEAWTRHAVGMLAPAAEAASFDLREWPPAGAVPLSTRGIYEKLAAIGLNYGPDFQGLRAAWRRGEDLYAEVQLPEAAAKNAEGFALHPALLDAALHALLLDQDRNQGVLLPFFWTGVRLRAVGATALRVRLQRNRV